MPSQAYPPNMTISGCWTPDLENLVNKYLDSIQVLISAHYVSRARLGRPAAVKVSSVCR